MTEATKTRKTKVESIAAPREIREITKARREWLAAKLVEVNARPGFEGKIVGNGSYQEISVYSVTQVAGRLRHRGHCQFCGNSQVVDGGTMVLHGYSRPGIGYVFNECPCVGRPPLEVAENLTKGFLNDAQVRLAILTADLKKAEVAATKAMNARYAGDSFEGVEKNSYNERPSNPSRNATPAEVEAFKVALSAWSKKFPLTAAVIRTENKKAELTNSVWHAKQQAEHFASLLARKLLGKALIEEVVA